MPEKVAIVYNDPLEGRLSGLGESGAVLGVLDEVAAVKGALEALGCLATVHSLRPPMSAAEAALGGLNADTVFNLFEGFDGVPGSEAALAALLESRGFRFTGNPSRAIALSLDKSAAKQVLRCNGVPTPDWQVLDPDSAGGFCLTFPCIVKPLGEHASHGISVDSVVNDPLALSHRVRFIGDSYGCASLVERFIPGREFTTLVIGNDAPRALPVEEIVYSTPPGKPKILTYAAKWLPDDEYFDATKPVCPAQIGRELGVQIQQLATASFAALGCRGYARVDMRQSEDGRVFVLEVNPNPDISLQSGARLQAQAAGMQYEEFIAEILALAREPSLSVAPISPVCLP